MPGGYRMRVLVDGTGVEPGEELTLGVRPEHFVAAEQADGDFRLVDEVLPLPRKGQVLLRNHWLSLDPYMRGRMNAGQIGRAHV